MLEKSLVSPSSVPQRMETLEFTYMSSEEIRRLSTVNVTSTEFYEPGSLKPAVGGVLDLRLGTTTDTYVCQTCGLKKEDCPGHFGSLELALPVFNVGFFTSVVHVLKCICKTCSNILLPNADIDKRLRRLYNLPDASVSIRLERKKAMMKECEKVTTCPHCGAMNGPIRKTKSLLLISHILKDSFQKKLESLTIKGVDVAALIPNACDDITPLRALQLFDNIPTRQIPLLTSGLTIASPSDMIIRTMVVPPVCIRPPVVATGEGTNQDDLTVRLFDAVRFNSELQKLIEVGRNTSNFAEAWNSLQQNLTSFINSDNSDSLFKAKKKDKPMIGIVQRLKGKQGRFRSNLSGKRVNFSGRTVISPDPNANIDQVVVPMEIAMILTFPCRVNDYNIRFLRQCVKNGPKVYPGANAVQFAGKNFKTSLSYGDPEKIARELKNGDIVERHLIADDTVLFNRQPSLHRISIMGFRAKIMPWRTLRFNECACAPFNADFDGDEMNIHLPQTLEAAADARVLMNILNNLFSPRAGEMIVAPTQDFLSGVYLLTRRNVFIDYNHLCFLLCQIFDAEEVIDIPPPAVVAPVQLWTGKQVISLMLRPNTRFPFTFTHSVPNKEYTGDLHMCKRDGYVSFYESELVSGVLEKSLIGGGAKSLWAIIARDESPKFAAICMQRVAKVAVRYMMNRGFSIGITDVTPDDQLTSKKQALIDTAYSKSQKAIDQFNKGEFEAGPGQTPAQTLESFLNGELSDVRNQIGKMSMQTLSNINTPLVMAKSGAKGSDINICQMMACVGQQSVAGQRIIDDFIDRTIPHFPHNSKDPVSKGFVASSFFTGLTPYEFFFHTMAGREGLVDSAVKTAQTGYMQRRLMKSLEDLVVNYDNTVRMSDGTVVQFVYGEDGLDPLVLENASFPVDLKRVSFELMYNYRNEPLASVEEIEEEVKRLDRQVRETSRAPEYLLDKLFSYIRTDIVDKYKSLLDNKYHSIQNIMPISLEFLRAFVKFSIWRAEKAIIEPGTAVGAVAGQSIGEPATQMTLRSFHFAGVASMNVTLGVPRVEEVMNAVNNIKTPIITAALKNPFDEIAARIVKGTIDRVTLSQVAKNIEYIQSDLGCYISIELDLDLISEAKMKIDSVKVKDAILAHPNIKVKSDNISVQGAAIIQISFKGMNPANLSFIMQQLLLKLPDVCVSGIEGVSRVFIDSKDKKYRLFVEGNALLNVMTTPGIDPTHTSSNHVLDMEKVLGIEAARSVIISEIDYVMKNYSLNIDRRHLMLLADTMTLKGKVNGNTRHGLAKTSNSSLKLASFEVTAEHLFNASFHQVKEKTNGISSSVILGGMAPIGSGLMDILVSEELISEKQLYHTKKFLTPQPPSKYRDSISQGTFDLRKKHCRT